MGGRNSGRWYRVKDKRSTLEQLRRLDVRALQREGRLVPWQRGILRWFSGGTCTAACAYWMREDAPFVLSYAWTPHGGEPEAVSLPIDLAWTPCHYGGQRPWFLCPGCAQRVAIFASYGKLFLCRQCAKLPYASQCETPSARGYRKVRKIRDKVGASHNLMAHIGDKPRGMQWRTFWTICAQEHVAHMQVLRRLTAALPPGFR